MSGENASLLRETIEATVATGAALTRLTDAIERAGQQDEARDREIIEVVRAEFTQHAIRLDGLTTALTAQAAAVQARADALLSIGYALRTRWVSVLVGLGVGLGLAGARVLLNAALSALGSTP